MHPLNSSNSKNMAWTTSNCCQKRAYYNITTGSYMHVPLKLSHTLSYCMEHKSVKTTRKKILSAWLHIRGNNYHLDSQMCPHVHLGGKNCSDYTILWFLQLNRCLCRCLCTIRIIMYLIFTTWIVEFSKYNF